MIVRAPDGGDQPAQNQIALSGSSGGGRGEGWVVVEERVGWWRRRGLGGGRGEERVVVEERVGWWRMRGLGGGRGEGWVVVEERVGWWRRRGLGGGGGEGWVVVEERVGWWRRRGLGGGRGEGWVVEEERVGWWRRRGQGGGGGEVDDVPPYFKMEPVQTQVHLEKNRLVLTCMAEGSWPLEFKWIYNGSELTRFTLEYRWVTTLPIKHSGPAHSASSPASPWSTGGSPRCQSNTQAPPTQRAHPLHLGVQVGHHAANQTLRPRPLSELTRFTLEYRYLIPSLDRGHAGHYRCVVRNRVGAIMQCSTEVQVAYMGGFVEGERVQTVSQGEGALVQAPRIHSFPRPQVTWFRDGRKIPSSSRM
ncbi:hypothetical protein NHX12_031182 [Muraenolepis orangiensis]|uniref:Ig-like domain-containing protein n=1 Tax=Muraenolepis orangiensis TaxID=630683 RepID=A0A9Q0E6I3_9TELE|nr:hypothetical protein NHX12_031182 [Muraenolepis orangiensis]